MAPRQLALANDPVAEEAAAETLLSGGSAVGAMLAGYFAAAGAHAGVLLAPLTLLIGGIGAGARVFDGRLRQPGLGTKRPRGFTAAEPIPDAARIAIPTAPIAALVANAYDGTQSLATLLRVGVARAQRGGASDRAALLRRLREVGASALGEAAFARPLLAVAGPADGGLVTAADLGAVPTLDHAPVERVVGGVALVEAPWARDDVTPEELAALGIGSFIAAVDAHGVFAVAAYRRVVDGMVIDALELEAPLVAVPVQRGVTRVAPGQPLPVPAPIAFVKDEQGTLIEVVAAPGATRLESPAEAPYSLKRDPNGYGVVARRPT